jgi:pyridoxamine 5'-phosphate oxidase
MKPLTSPIQRTQLLARHLHHTMAAKSPFSPAPWRSDFLYHLKSLDAPTCVFSTLHYEPVSSAGAQPIVTPRSRTVVFRGMWASLPVNPKNPAPLNPSAYESDLLTITNDARMQKTGELFGSAPGDTSSPQTGGGGPIEAVFWVVPTRTQWRIRGHAYVLGPDVDAEGAAPVREAIQKYMRPTGGYDIRDWDWDRELTAHFGNLSPGMRGSFKNPPPGTPLSEKPSPGMELGQKVEDLHDKIARENFRVVVIVPEEVDRVDLTDPAEGKRWNYKLVDGSWETTELWP